MAKKDYRDTKKQWEEKVKSYEGMWKSSGTVPNIKSGQLDFVLEPTSPQAAKVLKALADPEVWGSLREMIMDSFLVKFRSWLDEKMKARSTKEYYPVVMEGSAGYQWSTEENKPEDLDERSREFFGGKGYARNPPSKMSAGFRVIRAGILKAIERTDSDGLVVGLGSNSELKSHRLNAYMGNQHLQQAGGSQELNSLFLAILWGTGIADNVGGEQNVRYDGRTKDHKRPGGNMDGSWWLGPRAGQGAHYLGQKGWVVGSGPQDHFLFDARSREPIPAVYEMINQMFEASAQDVIRSQYGDAFITRRK